VPRVASLHPELPAAALSRRKEEEEEEEEERMMDGLNGLNGLNGLSEGLEAALGLHAEPKDFTLLQVTLRSIVTYGAGLAATASSPARALSTSCSRSSSGRCSLAPSTAARRSC
jgi:hypothetical protein